MLSNCIALGSVSQVVHLIDLLSIQSWLQQCNPLNTMLALKCAKCRICDRDIEGVLSSFFTIVESLLLPSCPVCGSAAGLLDLKYACRKIARKKPVHVSIAVASWCLPPRLDHRRSTTPRTMITLQVFRGQ